MHKLLSFILLAVLFFSLQAYQIDQELAVHTLFRAKYALNRSTHAAAQQIVPAKLAEGIYAIDPVLARQAAEQYLRANLQLDVHNEPLPEAFLKQAVDILVFEVINEVAYPYVYVNELYNYQVVLNKPAVVMILRVYYPRAFHILGPVQWDIRGVSEIVHL